MKCYLAIGLLIFTQTIFVGQQNNYPGAKEMNGLDVGATAPDFEAVNHRGDKIQLGSLLQEGPVVLVFYRGHWCPVCNMHLKKLEEGLQDVRKKGAELIAISPEKSEFLDRTIEKTGASYELLHDEDYQVSQAYKVAFQPEKEEREMYNT